MRRDVRRRVPLPVLHVRRREGVADKVLVGRGPEFRWRILTELLERAHVVGHVGWRMSYGTSFRAPSTSRAALGSSFLMQLNLTGQRGRSSVYARPVAFETQRFDLV